MTQPRRKRRSKRKALKGCRRPGEKTCMSAAPLANMPTHCWRQRADRCKARWVVKGITAWVQHDEALGIETLCLYVQGHQGQRPNRATLPLHGLRRWDTHPLVAALVKAQRTTRQKAGHPCCQGGQLHSGSTRTLVRAWSRHHRHLLPPSMGSRREGASGERCRQPWSWPSKHQNAASLRHGASGPQWAYFASSTHPTDLPLKALQIRPGRRCSPPME